EALGIDDPVGAVSVHGVCGAWGTLAVGLFAVNPYGSDSVAGLFYGGGVSQLGVQAIGVLAAFAFAFGVGFLMFKLIHKTIGLRVSRKEELDGLDVHEHGSTAYANFRIYHD
ncbi:MAG TPA: ammonium transporter, partial [Spirochaetia bacterium]|nr:ammonium transporter [Spirochaetia bacterium]